MFKALFFTVLGLAGSFHLAWANETQKKSCGVALEALRQPVKDLNLDAYRLAQATSDLIREVEDAIGKIDDTEYTVWLGTHIAPDEEYTLPRAANALQGQLAEYGVRHDIGKINDARERLQSDLTRIQDELKKLSEIGQANSDNLKAPKNVSGLSPLAANLDAIVELGSTEGGHVFFDRQRISQLARSQRDLEQLHDELQLLHRALEDLEHKTRTFNTPAD